MSNESIDRETNPLREISDRQSELIQELRNLGHVTQEQIRDIRRREDAEVRREMERVDHEKQILHSMDQLRESIELLADRLQGSDGGPAA